MQEKLYLKAAFLLVDNQELVLTETIRPILYDYYDTLHRAEKSLCKCCSIIEDAFEGMTEKITNLASLICLKLSETETFYIVVETNLAIGDESVYHVIGSGTFRDCRNTANSMIVNKEADLYDLQIMTKYELDKISTLQ